MWKARNIYEKSTILQDYKKKKLTVLQQITCSYFKSERSYEMVSLTESITPIGIFSF